MVITKKLLNNWFIYNSNTGKLYWKINRGSARKGAEAGYIDRTGYRRIRINRKAYLVHRLIWFLENDTLPKELDHADRDPTNNHITNLREVTHKENMQNRSISKSNSSGCSGVTWCKRSSKWRARVGQFHIGLFKNLKDAINAREKAEVEDGEQVIDSERSGHKWDDQTQSVPRAPERDS